MVYSTLTTRLTIDNLRIKIMKFLSDGVTKENGGVIYKLTRPSISKHQVDRNPASLYKVPSTPTTTFTD